MLGKHMFIQIQMSSVQGISVIYYELLVWCNQNILGRSISVSPYFFVAAEIIWSASAMWHRWILSGWRSNEFKDMMKCKLLAKATSMIILRNHIGSCILQCGGLTPDTILNNTNRWRQNRIPFWQKDRRRIIDSLEPLLTLIWYFCFLNHGLSTVIRLLLI